MRSAAASWSGALGGALGKAAPRIGPRHIAKSCHKQVRRASPRILARMQSVMPRQESATFGVAASAMADLLCRVDYYRRMLAAEKFPSALDFYSKV